MTNINVELTPELQEIVAKNIQSGLYKDGGEFVRELIRKHYFYSDLYQVKLQKLRDALAPGIKDVLEGNFEDLSYENLIAELDNKSSDV